MVIWARDVADNQVKGFVVEPPTPGFSTTKMRDKIALRVVQNAYITLDGVRVPEANRLQNANSFRDTAAVLRLTRAGVAWMAVGCARGAYEHALAYAKERQQFGRPIAGFQLVQDQLVRMLANVTSSACLCVRLSQLQEAGHRRRPALGAGQGVLHGAHAGNRRPGPGAARRQRDPARVPRGPVRGRRRGDLLLRGHQGDQHPDRRAAPSPAPARSSSASPSARRHARGRTPSAASGRASATGVRWPGSLAAVRLTTFWDLMNAQFGETYAQSVAKDQVLAALGDRTVNQALADGEDAKMVWRAVCETFDVPERLR